MGWLVGVDGWLVGWLVGLVNVARHVLRVAGFRFRLEQVLELLISYRGKGNQHRTWTTELLT